MATSGTPSKSSTSAPRSAGTGAETGARTLGIDVGGSHIKAAVLDRAGGALDKPARIDTPVGSPPEVIVDAIADLVSPLAPFDRISVGFPGVVRDGVVLTAPNLGNEGWQRFDLAGALTTRLGKPTRVLNDADMQGLGAIRGRGLEMVITLGTGFGTGLYLDGRLLPHLEIAHLRFRKGETYDERLGNAARKKVGDKGWSRRVEKAIADMRRLTNFDHLYVGGGNAKRLTVWFEPNPDISIVSNEAGIDGGAHAWHD
jgi:polyphosphate glucokinase